MRIAHATDAVAGRDQQDRVMKFDAGTLFMIRRGPRTAASGRDIDGNATSAGRFDPRGARDGADEADGRLEEVRAGQGRLRLVSRAGVGPDTLSVLDDLHGPPSATAA